MKNMKKNLLCLILALILANVLVSCGASSKTDSYNAVNDMDPSYRIDAETKAAGDDYIYEGALVPTENAQENREKSDTFDTFVIYDTDEKLVYTCHIGLETTTFKDTMAAIRKLITSYEGFIEQDELSDNDEYWYYEEYTKNHATLNENLVVRIPTKHYTDFLNELGGQGKIRTKTQQVENITTAYSDTETTINSLKIQEKRLLEMMEEADNVTDMLEIEDRLTDVQNELRMVENRLSAMDVDIAYSTIHIDVMEVLEYTKDAEPVKTSTFSDRLKNTLKDSWEDFLLFLENALFFLIHALPILVILGIFAAVIVFAVKKISGNRKRKIKGNAKEAVYKKPEENEDKE